MRLILFIVSILAILTSTAAAAKEYPPAQYPLPTPTPGTPAEWSDWLEEQPDVELIQTGEYNPVATYGGTHAVPWHFVKQSRKADVAVKIERGYTEATSPIDPDYIGGLRFVGYVATGLVQPSPTPEAKPLRMATSDRSPGREDPSDLSAKRPPKPGDLIPEGRVSRVEIRKEAFPGAQLREAVILPTAELVRVIEFPGRIERIPWLADYSVHSGPVWIKIEVVRE